MTCTSHSLHIDSLRAARAGLPLRPVVWAGVLLAFALAAPATAAPPADVPALHHWATTSLDCSYDPFGDLQNRTFIERMKALGAKLTTEWQEGDIPEGEFDLPQPLAFGGQSVTHIKYWADSGAEFYAVLEAAPEDLAKALSLKPVPAKNRKDFDDKTVAVRFVGPRKDMRLPPALFVRRSEDGKSTEVGCRYFDG